MSFPSNEGQLSPSSTITPANDIPAPRDRKLSPDIIIDWDGPQDPDNPKNWPFQRKWGATFVVSSFTFISHVSSTMIAPATFQAASDLGVRSNVVIAMMTSIFLLGFACGPLVLGPLSEILGRSRVLQLSNLFYLIWNLACGFATSPGQYIAFRFLAGLGGGAPFAIGGGVLGDLFDAEERGKAISIYSLAPFVGPALGPMCGAWIAEGSTHAWRWVFWSTSIFDTCIQISGLFYLQETYAPVLLERKAEKIRKSLDPEKAQMTTVCTIFDAQGHDRSWTKVFKKGLTRPFMIFGREFIAQLLGVYMAFVYGVYYLFLTTATSIFTETYHESVGIAGLHLLAIGFGLFSASQINAMSMDRIYVYFKVKNEDVGEPEFRLPSMGLGSVILPVGLLMAGWAAELRVHWIVVDTGNVLIAASLVLISQSTQTYVIDVFTLHAASALAVVFCLRTLAGFGFPLFAPAMFGVLGHGKGCTVLAVVSIALGCPAPWIFWKYGKRIRMSSTYARKERYCGDFGFRSQTIICDSTSYTTRPTF